MHTNSFEKVINFVCSLKLHGADGSNKIHTIPVANILIYTEASNRTSVGNRKIALIVFSGCNRDPFSGCNNFS